MKRRQWLQATALGTLAPALSTLGALTPLSARAAAKPLKIGFIYPGPVSNVGWTFQHDLGRKLVEKTFGAQVQTVFVENVPESNDAERVIRQLVMDGCTMIFTTSFGFMESTLKVAQEFPDVIFEHATGYKMAKNVGIYQTRFYEGAYLIGMVAGRMTKTNNLGFVASFPIPEVLRNINAFTHGARSVNPKVRTKVVWINSWYDPARERDAAMALSGQQCDVFYQNTDSPAIVQLAQTKGLYAFGQDSDMRAFGPKAHLTANTVNWGVYYVHKVRQALVGQWKAEDTKWGMKEGMIELPALNPVVPPDVAKLFNDKKAAILAGQFHPFRGPVKDQAGALKIAAGQTISDSELWGMKWYVEGVDGKLP
ncbi:MAG: BMP family ABC transporter substrate-binding protein [Aquabacterium sp.]|uniref:BMP family ABC transporter substrate-binding protein n=1 Tax=Aquabacterium sp. TaxID=1872578 RepID=UPI002718BCEC|nr:BMP family ABC transporter substrate-binding protein [Aquabacterium sp.]MDO9005046.1 BMP family ABC transporter substrate-binding protein [Aquabacterium sp.]